MKRQLNKQKEKNAAEREIKRLDSEQLALKILANATSYGVFIELNVEETDEQNDVLKIHTATGSRKAHGAKREEPGEYSSTRDWTGPSATLTAWRSPRPREWRCENSKIGSAESVHGSNP